MHNISSAPKSEIYHFRINPEVKKQVEDVYAKNGVTFTQTINAFIQQSLNVGGFLFLVSADNAELLKVAALKKLMVELESGKESGECVSNDAVICVIRKCLRPIFSRLPKSATIVAS